MVMPIQNIFDLHCDTLTECYKRGVGLVNNELHFSLDRLPEHMRLCQAMAIFMPDDYRGQDAELYFDNVLALFQSQLRANADQAAQVVCTKEIDDILNEKQFALMLTVEGGSALAGKLENVYKLHKAGVKMMTLTWNGENEICGGAATDKGFSDFGRALIPLMEELGMVVDVSHLSDRSFYELCEFAAKPFAASHSNSRTVCPHRRNLTDDMFRIIRDRGGVVGLNYYKNFIVESGGSNTMDDLLRHVHHFLELGGENTLVLGSDFDGADIPAYIAGLDKVEHLWHALEHSGIPAKVVQNILYENARCFFAGLGGGN